MSRVREISFISVPGRSKIERQRTVENGFPSVELNVEECGEISFISVPGRLRIERRRTVDNVFPLLKLNVEECEKNVKGGEPSLAA